MRSLGGLAGMGKGGMPGGFGSSMPMPPPSGGFGKRGR